ncbi:ATP-binding protein, partial [Patescibacteria group bacterium]|nr:ATP-binding protein [Patescibacteria group bacterium]
GVHTSLNTGPLSSAFPFVSFDLSSNEGVLYGVNRHNNSLILFDRFSLENANETVFGVSGSGKSYYTKLEILRYLMTGVDTIVLDPENEYQALAATVGGSFFDISLGSENHLNPFDLARPRDDEKPGDVLRSNIINLVGLMRLMLGGLTPEEDAVMDRALTETYASKDITPDSDPTAWQENIPLMGDLEQVLETMEGADSLVRRLQKFTQGTYANFFNQRSNISLQKGLVVFGIRNMEEGLRPMAMFVIIRYLWNMVRSELKRRILVIDEAWWIMQSEDGASFLFGLTKRARKYWLGVTTITQDIGDFMKSEYGKPIITNSALTVLMKQSPATIDVAQETFNLTGAEKDALLSPEIGEGIFFAGQKHVLMQVVASPKENSFLTTSPGEVAKQRRAKQEE